MRGGAPLSSYLADTCGLAPQNQKWAGDRGITSKRLVFIGKQTDIEISSEKILNVENHRLKTS
jgi:hypothetical protein